MTGAALTTEQKARSHADEAEPCEKKGQRRNEICRPRTPLAVNHEMIARLDDYERRRGSREKAARACEPSPPSSVPDERILEFAAASSAWATLSRREITSDISRQSCSVLI